MQFELSDKCDKQLSKLDFKIRKQFLKNVQLLLNNKHHPSLNFEKINHPFYSIRINRNFRAVFYFKTENLIYFSYISNHDIYKKIKNL
jgi:mRNA-degrading endonuclease RelE of RelBE toxin-antitoxin system